jgi:hypothetical protein
MVAYDLKRVYCAYVHKSVLFILIEGNGLIDTHVLSYNAAQ